jgi:hypothetical protein
MGSPRFGLRAPHSASFLTLVGHLALSYSNVACSPGLE